MTIVVARPRAGSSLRLSQSANRTAVGLYETRDVKGFRSKDWSPLQHAGRAASTYIRSGTGSRAEVPHAPVCEGGRLQGGWDPSRPRHLTALPTNGHTSSLDRLTARVSCQRQASRVAPSGTRPVSTSGRAGPRTSSARRTRRLARRLAGSNKWFLTPCSRAADAARARHGPPRSTRRSQPARHPPLPPAAGPPAGSANKRGAIARGQRVPADPGGERVITATSQLFLRISIATKMRAGSQSDAAGEAIVARSAISLSDAPGG